MTLGIVLLLVIIVMLAVAYPAWPHSRSWGYQPSGWLGLAAVAVLILLFTGRL